MVNRIKELRDKKGWSQERLAAECDPPTSGQEIGRLERGTRRLTQAWMERLAGPLGVEAPDLLPLHRSVKGVRELEQVTHQEKVRLLSTFFGRLSGDALDRIIESVYAEVSSEVHAADNVRHRKRPH